MKQAIILIAALILAPTANACSTIWNITLETFGEGVTVELCFGKPGNSKVVGTRQSSGGQVGFRDLCAGNYFLAIGNSEQVSVTPVRSFQDGASYSSKIVVQRGAGNVSRRSRSSL